jgi:uncharacterized protein YerC
MGRRAPEESIDAARLLLVEYYTSKRTRHTFDSIARRSGLSRATVGRLAREVREALPTVQMLHHRIEQLEARIVRLERSPHRFEVVA